MKKLIQVFLAIIILSVSVIGLTACGKSTADQLQAHEWTFKSDKSTGVLTTAKFSKDELTLNQLGFGEIYNYRIDKKDGQEEITFTTQKDGKTEKRVFKISRNGDKFRLIAKNELAISDTGNVSLIPK